MKESGSFRYAIVPDENIARIWLEGHATAKLKMAVIHAFRSDPLWKPGLYVIWDCMRDTAVILAPTDIPALLNLITEEDGMDLFYGNRHIAYGVAKLFALLERRKGRRAHVCETMADVLTALGRDSLPTALRDPADKPVYPSMRRVGS